MTPVPIYTKSPISAAKASGVTPETAAPAGAGPAESSLSPTTRTVGTSSSSSQGYPSARPGAVPSVPAPTGSSSSSLDQRHAPIRPTPTATQEAPDQGPPPPQPGAAPVAPSATALSSHPHPHPHPHPPPRASGTATRTAEPPHPSGLPHLAQTTTTNRPPPTIPYVQRGTSTTAGGPLAGGSGRGPGRLQPQPLSSSSDDVLSHPPGYHQNVGAAEFSSYQRAAHDALVASGGGGGGGSNGSGGFDDDDESVWNSAKKLAQMAGEKLSAAESEVWRRINKE